MNSARQRRPAIAARARKAMLRRLSRQRPLRKKGQDVVMPQPRNVVEGRVYLDYNNSIEPLTYTSLWVTLPADRVATAILEMQKEGFWAPRPQKGEMVFIPAGRILQVQLHDKNKIGDEKP